MSMHTELFGFHLLGLSANPESQDIKKAIKYMRKTLASVQNISHRVELLMLPLPSGCALDPLQCASHIDSLKEVFECITKGHIKKNPTNKPPKINK